MRADIVIVGQGLAGSLAAAVLGRAGHDVHVVDPHGVFPPEFRCEKLEEDHLRVLGKTGLAPAVMRAGTHLETIWIARYGRVIDRMPMQQYAMRYDTLVNAIRAEVPSGVAVSRTWVDGIEAGAKTQRVRLSNGQAIDARLTVLASGLNWTLREALGIERDLVSACHSVVLGFDIRRADGGAFAFPALQYFPDRGGTGVAYLTLFRIDGTMRANLFLYLPLRHPSIAAFRADARAALNALLPGLARTIGHYAVEGPVRVRPTDLHIQRNTAQPGVVAIGDAFATPCPVTGTGTMKVFNDVERLCHHHVPRWLSASTIGVEEVMEFYRDPVKLGCDLDSSTKAYTARSLALDRTLKWRSRRALRFAVRLSRWTMRSAYRRCRDALTAETMPEGRVRGRPVRSTGVDHTAVRDRNGP